MPVGYNYTMTQSGKFLTIFDQAWGSSAKGAASTRLADILNIKNASSCNAPNAGHYVQFGEERFLFKSLPSASSLNHYKRKNIVSWIGPNSGFFLDQFEKEIKFTESELGRTVFVHDRAVIMDQRHADAESPTGDKSTLRISSTMSGSGAAFTEKMMRGEKVVLARDVIPATHNWKFYEAVQRELDTGHDFIHEVSQGFALSVNAGTHYPFCTFRDCTPQQAFADFGIKPKNIGDVYMNVRSFLIRVGSNFDQEGNQIGYSGDTMYDSIETTWEKIGKEAGMPDAEIKLLLQKELTSVSKKLRRCFTQSWELMRFAAKFCGATKLILNFPQYIDYNAYGMKGGHEAFNKLPSKVREYIDRMEDETNLPCVMVGTGPEHDEYIWLG